MKEDKAQRKEGEDEGVFLRFGDDLAVDDKPHRAVGSRRKIRISHSRTIIESSRKEIADGFVDNARPHPSGRIPAGIRQTASRDPNPHIISIGSIIQEEVGNGSAAAADEDPQSVGGAGGKGDVGFAASGNSRQPRVPVCSIGAGKQGRKRDV